MNESYDTTIYHVRGKEWAEKDNKTDKVKWTVNENNRTPDFIEFHNAERNQTWRIGDTRMELQKGNQWQWLSDGRWLKDPVSNNGNEGDAAETAVATNGIAKRVKKATAIQLDQIGSGLEEGYLIRRDAAWSVKSKSHENAYYIVAYLDGLTELTTPGAWLRSGSPNESRFIEIILAANRTAEDCSKWPNGAHSEFGAWETDNECKMLLEFAQRAHNGQYTDEQEQDEPLGL